MRRKKSIRYVQSSDAEHTVRVQRRHVPTDQGTPVVTNKNRFFETKSIKQTGKVHQSNVEYHMISRPQAVQSRRNHANPAQ